MKKTNVYTKKELCADIHSEFGGSYVKNKLLLEFLIRTISKKLKENTVVSIAKLGIFRRKIVPSSVRHNPKNMQKVITKPHGKVTFKVAEALKDIVF